MRIVLGISGGIAAVKIPMLLTELKKKRINIIPIVTQSASHIIDVNEIQSITGQQVYSQLFPNDYSSEKILQSHHVEHIDIADSADLFVIAPATANILAKLAHGVADDYLSTTVLATQAPVLLFPSMNVHMWNHPTVVDNLNRCKDIGYHIYEPVSGSLACGYEGKGRLPEIDMIVQEIERFLHKKTLLKGKRILITAGGTIEPIDDARVMTNRSSGKMGVALADACFLSGAEVTLLRAKNSVSSRYTVKEELFTTSDELEQLMQKNIPGNDICIHVAAVSDFFVERYDGKIASDDSIYLQLKPREKIYKKIKKWNPHIFLMTFKAEPNLSSKEWDRELRQVFLHSSVDAVIGNDIGKPDQGFQVDTNAAIVYCRDGRKKEFGVTTKQMLAEQIIEFLFLPPHPNHSVRHEKE